jgi:hypothetical protein
MRKINKYDIPRQFNPKILLILDIYVKKGFCLYTTEQFDNKSETVK